MAPACRRTKLTATMPSASATPTPQAVKPPAAAACSQDPAAATADARPTLHSAATHPAVTTGAQVTSTPNATARPPVNVAKASGSAEGGRGGTPRAGAASGRGKQNNGSTVGRAGTGISVAVPSEGAAAEAGTVPGHRGAGGADGGVGSEAEGEAMHAPVLPEAGAAAGGPLSQPPMATCDLPAIQLERAGSSRHGDG